MQPSPLSISHPPVHRETSSLPCFLLLTTTHISALHDFIVSIASCCYFRLFSDFFPLFVFFYYPCYMNQRANLLTNLPAHNSYRSAQIESSPKDVFAATRMARPPGLQTVFVIVSCKRNVYVVRPLYDCGLFINCFI